MQFTEGANSLNMVVRQRVIDMLVREGYGTYARRLQDFKFNVAEFFHGSYCPVAFMTPSTGDIVINPGFVVDMGDTPGDEGPIFSQLSTIVRHELLHFLLCHEKRLVAHLKKTDPDFDKTYKRMDIHTLANFAMDYELADQYYDDYDKEVVKMAQLNGRAIHGLLIEEQVHGGHTSAWGRGLNGTEDYIGPEFNNWEGKSMEDMFQMLRDAHEKLLKSKGIDPENQKKKPTVTLKRKTNSQEYQDYYNKIMKLYSGKQVTAADIQDLISRFRNGEDVSEK